jgi:3-dehydroquinate dehydratase I
MICVSLKEHDPARLCALLDRNRFAEVRLDGLEATLEGVAGIFARPQTLVATLRPDGRDDAARALILAVAVAAGAAYVDVELESGEGLKSAVISAARRAGCRVIVSHHDEGGTPSRDRLEEIVGECFAAGADVAKVACRVASGAEVARLVGLLDGGRPVVPIGMGPLGGVARAAALLLGAPFVYASAGPGLKTADGQPAADALRAAVEEVRRAVG